MFTENFKSKELELSRIRNLSEFALNLDECKTVFSKDLKYCVIYTESSIVIIDMNKKSLISKFSNEKDHKISKLKITHNNIISYINKVNDKTFVVISSIDFIGYFFELTVSREIQDYVYVDLCDYIFTLSSNGELEFHFLGEPALKKRGNIIKDSGNRIQPGFEVNYMEFIEETRNLIIILSNGVVVNYTVSYDPESDHMSQRKTVNFEEIKHLDNFALEKEMKVIYKLNNSFDVSTLKITKFVFDFSEDYPSNIEGDQVKERGNNNLKNRHNVVLVIGYTKNKCDTYFSFYELQSNGLVFLNRVIFKGRTTLDSQIYQTKNTDLNNQVPDYFIVCCKVLGSNVIEVLASDFLQCLKSKERSGEGMLIDEEGYGNKEKKDQDAKDTFTVIQKIEDNNTTRRLGIVGVYCVRNPDFTFRQNISNINRSFIMNEDNRSVSEVSNINDYRNLDYSINLIIRKLVNFQNFDVFIIDSNLQQALYQPKKLIQDINMQIDEMIIPALTSDVSKHLDFFDKDISNSNDKISLFRNKVIRMIKDEPLYNSFQTITKLDEHNSKVDYYLLLLLFNNELFSIKFYLSLRESYSTKQFLVSNDKLYFTVYLLYFKYLKQIISDHLNTSSTDYSFFTVQRLLNNLENIFEILKISKNRVQHPYERPFNKETDILSDDTKTIQTALFEIQNIILIIKIIRSFVNNIIKNEIDFDLESINDMMRANMQTKKENRNISTNIKRNQYLYFELITMNSSNEIYPNMKRLFLSFFTEINPDLFTSQDSSSNQEFLVNDVLYFSKLQLFFYYMYYVLDYIKFWRDSRKKTKENFPNYLSNSHIYPFEFTITDRRNLKTEFFSEMNEEFNEYYKLLENFYLLDLNLLFMNKNINSENKNYNISVFNQYTNTITNAYTNSNNNPFKIDISTISEFLIKFNRCKLTKTRYYQEHLNILKVNPNSLLISILFNDNYSKEALTLSKNIINLLSEHEDMITQLCLLLELGLINLAYQFVNNCFACLVCYSEELENDSNPRNRNLLDAIVNSEEFKNMKLLYFHFYEFLIRNNHLALLFTMPYNFIERYILKELLMTRKEYEELILLYFIKLRKINEAENCFSQLEKSNASTQETLILYHNLLDTMKFLFSEYEEEGEVFGADWTNGTRGVTQGVLSYHININTEKHKLDDLGKSSNYICKNINQIAVNVLMDSFLDIDNIGYKPSNTTMNDTLKSLLCKKQETAKKTFGMFSDVKSNRRLEFDNASERLDRNPIDNSKFKSILGFSKSNQKKSEHTPNRNEQDFVIRPISFNTSNIIMNSNSREQKFKLDF